MSKAVCLICGNARICTVCGDQSCPCRGGPRQSGMRPVFIVGMGWTDSKGRAWVIAECGRHVSAEKWEGMKAAADERG